MYWQFTPYVLPLFIASLVSFSLAFYAWRRRPASGAAVFAWLSLSVAIWSLGYALEIGSISLASKVFWAKVQYLGIAALPLLWAIFALQYTNHGRWLTRRNLLLLATILVGNLPFTATLTSDQIQQENLYPAKNVRLIYNPYSVKWL